MFTRGGFCRISALGYSKTRGYGSSPTTSAVLSSTSPTPNQLLCGALYAHYAIHCGVRIRRLRSHLEHGPCCKTEEYYRVGATTEHYDVKGNDVTERH